MFTLGANIIKLRLELNYLLSFICLSASWLLFYRAVLNLKTSKTLIISWDLLFTTPYKFELSLLIDPVSLIFSRLVLFITGSVILFSKYYINRETHYTRFHYILISFVISILLLVFGVSLVSIVLGWDGLGVTSYLLVIYYSSWKRSNAGILTALINRVGDFFIILAISFFILEGGYNLNLTALHSSSVGVYLICLLVFARITKSAQIPFSAWLPAAIAAPTPVSSLVHSSTLVTAGVYLIIRFEAALTSESMGTIVLLVLGTMTIIIAGLSALSEIDIKKIVALSTLRQLGLMISAIGCNNWSIRYFHLLTHAYIKALLFIRVGNLIHSRLDYQDLRKVSLSMTALPLRASFLACTNLRLCGFPFFSTFYSKDMWLEYSYSATNPIFIYLLFGLAVVITVLYSARLIFYLLIRKSERLTTVVEREERVDLKFSIILLWTAALTSGPTLGWLLFKSPTIIFLPLEVKTLTIKAILISVPLYFFFFRRLLYNKKEPVYWRASNIWALPFISAPIGIKVFIIYALRMAFFIDKGNLGLRLLGGVIQEKKRVAHIWGEAFNKYRQVIALIFSVIILLVL